MVKVLVEVLLDRSLTRRERASDRTAVGRISDRIIGWSVGVPAIHILLKERHSERIALIREIYADLFLLIAHSP